MMKKKGLITLTNESDVQRLFSLLLTKRHLSVASFSSYYLHVKPKSLNGRLQPYSKIVDKAGKV
jgi:hypothetical protein